MECGVLLFPVKKRHELRRGVHRQLLAQMTARRPVPGALVERAVARYGVDDEAGVLSTATAGDGDEAGDTAPRGDQTSAIAAQLAARPL